MSHVVAACSALTSVPVASLIASTPVFKIEASTSLRDAIRLLNDNGVTGAPVFVDEVTSVSGCGRRNAGASCWRGSHLPSPCVTLR